VISMSRSLKLFGKGVSGPILTLCFLATTCNSTVIEMCNDTIRISHGFEICQMLTFIRNSRLIVFCNLKVYDPYFDLVILTGP
jgi:hypothetical protein